MCHESVICISHDGGQTNSLPLKPVQHNILHVGSVLTAGYAHRFAIDKKKRKKKEIIRKG